MLCSTTLFYRGYDLTTLTFSAIAFSYGNGVPQYVGQMVGYYITRSFRCYGQRTGKKFPDVTPCDSGKRLGSCCCLRKAAYFDVLKVFTFYYPSFLVTVNVSDHSRCTNTK